MRLEESLVAFTKEPAVVENLRGSACTTQQAMGIIFRVVHMVFMITIIMLDLQRWRVGLGKGELRDMGKGIRGQSRATLL